MPDPNRVSQTHRVRRCNRGVSLRSDPGLNGFGDLISTFREPDTDVVARGEQLMSQESEPSVDPDTPPATPDEVQPNVDPERPLDPPEEPERVDPDHPLDPPGGPEIPTT